MPKQQMVGQKAELHDAVDELEDAKSKIRDLKRRVDELQVEKRKLERAGGPGWARRASELGSGFGRIVDTLGRALGELEEVRERFAPKPVKGGRK